jgi:aryl-alcohol dehydrogenase-like predicted oxidoreductase
MMDRRTFLESLSALTAGLLLPGTTAARPDRDRLGELLPRRRLGRTGEAVTMLGVGGWHIGRMSEHEAQATIETALAGGVRFFDSAESYQRGGSETYLGRFLVPTYRDVAFLMTKTTAGDAATARRHLEGSLRRLNTDYLDLWQVHSISSVGDVDARIADGVLDVVEAAKAEGKVRYVGFTGHTTPEAHLRMLERTDLFETCQMPVNVADVGYESFIRNVLPVLVERDVGVLAMKTLANGGFFGGSQHGQHGDNPRLVPGRVSIAEALQFVWSLPVSVLITGPDDVAQMEEKIALARTFEAMEEAQRQALIDRVADLAGPRVEFYKR